MEEKEEIWQEFKGSYQQLQPQLQNCIYVELLFRGKSESDIYYTQGMQRVTLYNLEEDTWDWDRFTKDFANIKSLAVRGCQEVSEKIFDIRSLVYLELNSCELRAFHFDKIVQLTKLEDLLVENSALGDVPEVIFKMDTLKGLSFMGTEIKELPDNLKKLKNLECLGLNRVGITQVPTFIGELNNLTSLYLGGNEVKELPIELKNLTKLEHLALWGTSLEVLPEWICSFKQLRGLYLGRIEKLQKLPENIGNLTNLEKLYLNGTGVRELPESFGKLANLKELLLFNTDVKRFPMLSSLEHLESCNLSNMVLEKIPRQFINARMKVCMNEMYVEEGLNLTNTKLLCQPISLFTHEKEFIYAYYDEEKIHLNETKVVFLGDGEAGKSHIIARLMKENQLLEQFEEEATPGIAISQKSCEIDRENVRLQIWDFGGQEIMHSMHRFFLTDRTLYVIVVNARDNTQDERAQYWLNNVKNFADGCPIILVLNKIDQNPTASLNERMLRTDYPQIKEIIKMSALKSPQEEFAKLMEDIVASVRMFDSYAMEFPVSWNRIKTALEEMDSNYITDKQYREICRQNGVEDEQIQNWLLDWFHDLGVSFNYRKKDLLLSGYMVLRPTWITNAIYIILFNGNAYARNGLIAINDIVKLLQNPPKSVEKITYDVNEVPYILGVMRRFEISYAVDNDNEFIPMMCDKNQHEDAEAFLAGDCLEYDMQYAYLPNNVLHKLMIKMRDDLDRDKIWLTGMILCAREGNISALVRMHDRRMEVYVRSSNSDIYPPKEYLSEIRDNLLRINRELNLTSEEYIVYKEGDASENINYQTLLIHLSSGQSEYFSTVFRRMIPIKNILGIVESETDTELIIHFCMQNGDRDVDYASIKRILSEEHSRRNYRELEEAIVECGAMIQGDSLQISEGKENDRNTYFRNMLSASKKFIVCDQTLNGRSANQKAAGELDLLIKDIKQRPMAVIEALTLSSVDKNYISEHIDKLFLYDTWGLINNYILVYVENRNFAGFQERYKDYISQHQYQQPVEYQGIEEKDANAEMAIFDVSISRNGQRGVITHILIHLQKP